MENKTKQRCGTPYQLHSKCYWEKENLQKKTNRLARETCRF